MIFGLVMRRRQFLFMRRGLLGTSGKQVQQRAHEQRRVLQLLRQPQALHRALQVQLQARLVSMLTATGRSPA